MLSDRITYDREPEEIVYGDRADGFSRRVNLVASIYGEEPLRRLQEDDIDEDRLFDVDILEAVKYLESLHKKNPEAKLSRYYPGYEEGYYITCDHWRDETAEERKSRLEREDSYVLERAKWLKAKAREKEGKRELARVKKKYGL